MDKRRGPVNYTEEITKMLFGFGDCSKPNENTVQLIESIVVSQLRGIIREALKYSKDDTLDGKELVFLMRHNKHKMRRFIKYLQNKELKKEIAQYSQINKEGTHSKEIKKEIESDIGTLNILTANQKPKHELKKEIMHYSEIKKEGNHSKEIEGDIGTLNILTANQKPKHDLVDFIEYIDETGELTDLTEFDKVKHARQVRANNISLVLDQTKYAEYQKARTVSFHSAGFKKFCTWIDPRNELTQKFTETAFDVLAYYAFETVAQIVDFAFQVRLDTKKGPDPINTYRNVYSIQQPFTVNEIKEVMRRVSSPQTGRLEFGKTVHERHSFLAL